MDYVVATGNKNKLQELRTIGDKFSLSLLSPKEAQEKYRLSTIPECEENGSTFEENALIKAKAFSEWSGLPSIGDDSGIEVEALDGAPGIYSARYAGEGKSDQDRIEKLLRELAEKQTSHPTSNRNARFYCALAAYFPDGTTHQSSGILSGHILEACRGQGGFGYDPILWIDELQATLAEVDFKVTCERGFRAKAAFNLFSQITKTRQTTG